MRRPMATPSAQYSLTIRVEIERRPGALGEVISAIGRAGGMIGAVDLIRVEDERTVRDLTVDAADQDHWGQILEAAGATGSARVIETTDRTFLMHLGGKIEQHNQIGSALCRERVEISGVAVSLKKKRRV